MSLNEKYKSNFNVGVYIYIYIYIYHAFKSYLLKRCFRITGCTLDKEVVFILVIAATVFAFLSNALLLYILVSFVC